MLKWFKTAGKGTEAYKDSLKALKDKGYDPLNQTIPQYIKLLKQQMLIEAKLEANKGAIQDALRRRLEAQDKIAKLEAKGMTRRRLSKLKVRVYILEVLRRVLIVML